MRHLKIRTVSATVLVLAALSACAGRSARGVRLSDAAGALATRAIIVDTHIDAPHRMLRSDADLTRRANDGEFDYIRCREGGLDAAFMSIYTPPNLEKTGGSKKLADRLIDAVDSLAAAAPGKFVVAASPSAVRQAFVRGRVALCLGMENGSPVEGDLKNLRHFYDRDVRYITLTHSKDNQICDSSYDTTRTWRGISEFGRRVVVEMNRLGIMVDVSHVSDDAFWQVMDITRAPVIASHSSCRHFIPGYERNISDAMIRRVAEGGGVVQINFGSTFVSRKAKAWADHFREERSTWMHEHHVEAGSDRAGKFRDDYFRRHPFPFAGVGDVVDHIDHVVSLVGVDHVGFGSDFDGVGNTLPLELKDVSQYPNLIRELLDRGYTEADVRKIAGENLLRVWGEVERVATEGR